MEYHRWKMKNHAWKLEYHAGKTIFHVWEMKSHTGKMKSHAWEMGNPASFWKKSGVPPGSAAGKGAGVALGGS